jgi:uncharacterized membrane protein (DUF441 family)
VNENMADDLPDEVKTAEEAKALLQSKKFWAALAGTLVTLAGAFGVAVTSEQGAALGTFFFIGSIFLLAFATKQPISGLLPK